MNHHCPECIPDGPTAETHRCDRCKDTYCVHFMKTLSAFDIKTKTSTGANVCWVCGSEKKRESDTVAMV